jgi:Tfp pilus assembly protein PilZ
MKGKKKDERRGKRVSALLPVEAGGATGIARDVSATGIFFETGAGFSIGSPVNLALDLDTPWGKVMLRCEGKVVRVERRDDTIGVAVQFTDSMPDLT